MRTSSDEYSEVARRVLSEGISGSSVGTGGLAGPAAHSHSRLFLLAAILIAILAASFYIEKTAPPASHSLECGDGTPYNRCSATLPFYCMNGELVEKASLCGCPENYSVNGSGCVLSYKCGDGTPYGKCSDRKPFYCSAGELIVKAAICGCPDGYSPNGEDCRRVLTCRDGTPYNKCSEKKPLYCRNGVLVNDSKACGCPEDYESVESTCISRYEGGADERVFPYTLRGRHGTIKMTVHEGLKQYLSAIPRVYYCIPKCPTQQQLEMRYLEEERQKPELLLLVEKIKNASSDPADRVRIAISLVQNIPYDTESADAGNITNRYPYEVLFDQRGVCGEKSRLLAFILRELGYGVCLLDYEEEDHMAVALKCPMEYAQYRYNNTGYCFLETTRVSILTDNTGEYSSDGGKLESRPSLLSVGDGMAFPAGEEYADARDWIALNERAAASGGTLEEKDYTRWKEIKDKYGIPTITYEKTG